MRRLVRLAFGCAALISLAGAARAADKVTYVLDWLPSGEETFLYIAVKEGLFAREGLDVTIRIGKGSADVIKQLGTGVAEFGSGGIGALMAARAQGPVPVSAILSIFNKQPDMIIAIKGGPITSIKSLAGRRVGTATFTSSNALWPIIARANGLDPDSVTLIKADPGALAPMLATGSVDALIGWVTSAPEIEHVLEQAGKSGVVMPWAESGLEGYGLSLFASDTVIKNNPDLVARFTRAYEDGVVASIASCHKGAEDLQAIVPEMDVRVAEEQCKTTIPLIKNEISEKNGMGTFEPALLAKTWDWIAKSQNFALDKLDPKAIVQTSFAPKS